MIKRKLASSLFAIASLIAALFIAYTARSLANRKPADDMVQETEVNDTGNIDESIPFSENTVIDGENTDEIGKNGTKSYSPQEWVDGVEQPANSMEKEPTKWESMETPDDAGMDTEEEAGDKEEETKIDIKTTYDSGLKNIDEAG